jgi:hypothetical protein
MKTTLALPFGLAGAVVARTSKRLPQLLQKVASGLLGVAQLPHFVTPETPSSN